MTKTEARALAARHMQTGYFRTSQTEGWITCPLCRERVTTAWLPWQEPHPHIRQALVVHLVDDHPTQKRTRP